MISEKTSYRDKNIYYIIMEIIPFVKLLFIGRICTFYHEICKTAPRVRGGLRNYSSGGAKAGMSQEYLSREEVAFQVMKPPVQPASRRALIWA